MLRAAPQLAEGENFDPGMGESPPYRITPDSWNYGFAVINRFIPNMVDRRRIVLIKTIRFITGWSTSVFLMSKLCLAGEGSHVTEALVMVALLV